jgi:deoxycytidylate deaminase
MIINAGIEEIIIEEGYPDKMAEEILMEGKIKVRYLK